MAWQLSSEDVITNCLDYSRPRKRVNTFLSRENVQNVFYRRSRTLVKLFVKLGIALLIGPTENCPISSPGRFLIPKLFWPPDEGFKIASCIASQTQYFHAIQIWSVSRCPLFLLKHSDSSRQGIVDRHV